MMAPTPNPTRRSLPWLTATLAVSLALLALLAMAGCGGSDPAQPAPQAGLPFPDTANKLMANFRTAYVTRDYTAFADLLTPDYETVLQPGTIARFPDVGDMLEATEEYRIHERMFSGQALIDPLGANVPAVHSIEFTVFEPIGGWTPAMDSSMFPGAESRLYDVVIVLDRGQAESQLEVHGNIQFFVTHSDSTADGVTRPYYRLRGQVDLTFDGKGVESSAWGSVKALFR
jgi:hypothetical protein